ncbi:dTDP-4-dehydrorhamnose reductase [Butyrivibrio sp. ob235]|uniref:dTDP-4-dehydrorhamnose reductase n=1 Tax=Butyrivibrio sp. ob235 TaxID=1761780 RepID=UPI0008D34D93|nr:dTDP-4-dehydrorhamnose reductase [Butyrivibrio sp. ob235]SEM70792.1 dTDP-4-dehydrorhamnose reductase [Butyrivibrio sp. ob235]
MKKILVTGCNGQLGRAIQQVYKDEVEFILTDVIEGDNIKPLNITNLDEVLLFVRDNRPDVIINCAAATNVDGCEKDWDFAFKLNAIGPRNLAIAANEIDAKLIHVSTDYVFPGNAEEPINEFQTPGPISAYGKTKYEGERFVQQFADKYFIVRTAWLYGDGKNFVKTMLKLAETHDEVSVVCDQLGSPTSAIELARMIYYIEATENYGIFHGTCEGDTNWADFTEEIFRIKGVSCKVNHVTSEEYKKMNPASADRPHYSILDNYMLRLTTNYKMADWKDALEEYLSE